MKGIENFEHISEEVARELEAIVGPENITTDPVYCHADTGMGLARETLYFTGVSQDAGCLVMPKTTEEVAGIVKVCNRREIPFVPVVTRGMATTGPSLRNDMVVIDLRRMDKLVVDERNMYAIVEPAVIYAQLQAAVMNRDLYTIVAGGGGWPSVLANTSGGGSGTGVLNYRVTESPIRRMNGIEWVSPEGEIYRMGGFVEGDDGGFWQGGLGPNAVGLIRGFVGWMGAMGVVTKLAVKLYPFQPQPLEPEGLGPDACVRLPSRVVYYNITFDTEGNLRKAWDEIAKAQIGAVINRVPSYWRGIAKARSNRDFRNTFWQTWDETTREMVAQSHILRVCLIGYTSPKQLEYEERVLADIINENNGTFRPARPTDEGTFLNPNTGDMWMPTGVFGALAGAWETTECIREEDDEFVRRLEAYESKGDYMEQKADPPWHCSWGFGRTAYTELHAWSDIDKLDPTEPTFNMEMGLRLTRAMQGVLGAAITAERGPADVFDVLRPAAFMSRARGNYKVWQDKFKQEFDPKGLSNPPWPYLMDVLLTMFPPEITTELEEAVKKVEQGSWKGNPEG